MAAVPAPPKQTLHSSPALVALGEALQFLPHHTKPFRKRHVLLLAIAAVLAGFMMVEIATVITRRSLDPRALFSRAITSPLAKTQSTVRSNYGFILAFDNQQFAATVRGDGIEGPANDGELKANKPLASVTLTPLPSRVPAPEAAANFEIRSETDVAAFAAFKAASPAKTDISAILANYFAPKPTNTADIVEQGRTTESINGTLMTKAIYQVNPKFAGNPTHTIVWTAEVQGKPLAIVIQGIMVGSGVPSSMLPIMKSVQLESGNKALGWSILKKEEQAPVIEQKYVADAVSPAVVKIYHLICGALVFKEEALSEDSCSVTTGSGFIVSEDGYIATNGHVVVYGAKDMLVNALLSNESLLQQFLGGTQLSTAEVTEIMSRADLTASVVSRVYDLPDDQLRLVNQRELTVVATGETPLDLKDDAAVKDVIADFKPRSDQKQATIIGYDYSSKDQLTVVADPDEGFSASDVALIKVAVTKAPVVRLNHKAMNQGQKIAVFGFPTDADNELTDNTKLGVSATSGTISSIRDAAGSASKLYQSDVDASHGNSGGPAVDEYGKVFGLLTYRFSSGDDADAAKSYIRDISDLSNLAKSKDVSLTGVSTTQDAWERGLEYYGKQHYSDALAQFKLVAKEYPAHRLVTTYIDLSQQAIKEGRDIKDPSMLLLLLGLGAGLGGLGAAIILIARHHGRHRVYRVYHQHNLRTT